MYYASKNSSVPPRRFLVSVVRRRWGRCSAVSRSSCDIGAVVGDGPGDGAEGCTLLRGAEDADRVAGFERQVCPWVWDHLVPPHDGQDGRPGLAPHPEVSYGVTEKATPGLVV